MKQILGNLCRASVAAAGVMVATSAVSAESKPVQFETEFDLGLAPGGAAFEAPGVGTANARVSASAIALDVSSAAARWEESIGAYLDSLLHAATSPAPAAQVGSADDAGTAAVVEAEIEALVAIEVAAPQPEVKPLPSELLEMLGIDPADETWEEPVDVFVAVPAKAEARVEARAVAPVNLLLLAPVLSHPMNCDMCHGHAESEAVKHAEQAAAPEAAAACHTTLAPSNIDDAAAWQKLADWAAARAAEGAAADDAGDAVTAESDLFFDFDFDFDFHADEDAPTE